jgi:predicted PurR-regulated permease PerM
MSLSRTVNILLLLVLLVIILIAAREILMPLCWAGFFAILLLPASNWLESRNIPRALAAIISIGTFSVFLFGVLYFLSVQMFALLSDLPDISNNLRGSLFNFRVFLSETFGLSKEFQAEQWAKTFESASENGLGSLAQALTSTAKTVTMLSLMPLFIFFFIYYRDVYFSFLVNLYKQSSRERTLEIVHKVRDVLQNYLLGMLLVTLIMGILISIVLSVLGIKYAIFFAVFLAIFNLIPYVGVFLSSLVTVFYVFLTSDTLFLPLLTLACLWGLQIFENNLITPYVVGAKVQTNPMAVIIALLSGGLIWGVSGMILFIPLVGAIKAVFEEFDSLKPYAILLGEKAVEKEGDLLS